MRTKLLIFAVAAMLPATFAAGQSAVPDLSMPRFYVEDRANVINSSQEQALNGILQELEQKTGVQYIILTVETTGGVPIEDFSIDLAHKRWKLGQKEKDNGLLFTLAVKDREYRFEVGYGLEGVITDAFAGQVGRDVLVPYLKKGDTSTGVYEANLRIIQRIAQAEGVKLTGMPTLPQSPAPTDYGPLAQRDVGGGCCVCPCCGLLILMFLLMGIFGGRGRRGFGGGWWLLLLPLLFRGMGGGRRRGYYGGPFGGGLGGFGGGFGGRGGGFGGFGGGRGGGFGGGGASGRW